MGNRVKLIYQKSGSTFSEPIPIGSSGLYIDMISGLDLEEELKIGGNHIVLIVESDPSEMISSSTITEYYGTGRSSSNYNYVVKTIITLNDGITTINSSLFNNLSLIDPLHTKYTLINNNTYEVVEKLDYIPPSSSLLNEGLNQNENEGES